MNKKNYTVTYFITYNIVAELGPGDMAYIQARVYYIEKLLFWQRLIYRIPSLFRCPRFYAALGFTPQLY